MTPGAYIGLDNAASWAPVPATMVGHIQTLRLTGCYVGSGQDGADLLEQVSCAIEAPVLAPTGWAQAVAHENITLQDGSVWQLGQCNMAPHPIPVSNKPTPPPAPALQFLMETGEREVVPVERVQSLDFKRSGSFWPRSRTSAPAQRAGDMDMQASRLKRLGDARTRLRPVERDGVASTHAPWRPIIPEC